MNIRNSEPQLHIRLGLDPSTSRIAPEYADLSVRQDFLAKLKDVQAHVLAHKLSSITIEGEPDAWGPAGIAVKLRLGEIDLVVDGAKFWFQAPSHAVGVTFKTAPKAIAELERELNRAKGERQFMACA